MQKLTVRHQRRVLRGWIKWVPVLAIPFSILFFHAWINVQILRADYVLRELDAETDALVDRLNDAGIAQTAHEDPEVLAARAGLLNFVPPQPGQREVIAYDPADFIELPEDTAFELARRDAPSAAESAADHARTESMAANTTVVVATSAVATVPVEVRPEPVSAPQVELPVPTLETAAGTPVLLEIDVPLEPLKPLNTALSPLAPATTSPGGEVVLSLPDTAYVEAFPGSVDTGMGALESL